jgi:hypothetical protein
MVGRRNEAPTNSIGVCTARLQLPYNFGAACTFCTFPPSPDQVKYVDPARARVHVACVEKCVRMLTSLKALSANFSIVTMGDAFLIPFYS